MPINSRYNSPFTATPTIPSTIATITSSRKKAIIRSSALSAGQRRASRRSPPPPGSYVKP
jgi:hypothetical protein